MIEQHFIEYGFFQTSLKMDAFHKAWQKHFAKRLSVKKAGENDFFRDKKTGKASKYATLEGAMEATDEELAKSGFYRMQLPVGGKDVASLLCRIVHSESDQFIQWLSTFPIEAPTPQKAKSAITYARRTNITSSENLVEEDDDGNAASGNQIYSRDQGKDLLKILDKLGLKRPADEELMGEIHDHLIDMRCPMPQLEQKAKEVLEKIRSQK